YFRAQRGDFIPTLLAPPGRPPSCPRRWLAHTPLSCGRGAGGEAFVPLPPDQCPTESRVRTRELSHLHAVSRFPGTAAQISAYSTRYWLASAATPCTI